MISFQVNSIIMAIKKESPCCRGVTVGALSLNFRSNKLLPPSPLPPFECTIIHGFLLTSNYILKLLQFTVSTYHNFTSIRVEFFSNPMSTFTKVLNGWPDELVQTEVALQMSHRSQRASGHSSSGRSSTITAQTHRTLLMRRICSRVSRIPLNTSTGICPTPPCCAC